MNYREPKTLLGALIDLEDLFSQGQYGEHNKIIAKIKEQWPGFEVIRSTALKKYGLFPEDEGEIHPMAEAFRKAAHDHK